MGLVWRVSKRENKKSQGQPLSHLSNLHLSLLKYCYFCFIF